MSIEKYHLYLLRDLKLYVRMTRNLVDVTIWVLGLQNIYRGIPLRNTSGPRRTTLPAANGYLKCSTTSPRVMTASQFAAYSTSQIHSTSNLVKNYLPRIM